MQHKVNDRERQIVRLMFCIDFSFTYFPKLQSTKEAVAKMENRMSTMEKEMEEQLRVRLTFCYLSLVHLLSNL